VHHESLLMNILYSRSDFTTQLYRAIIEYPTRMDLWEECRLIYVDRENPKRAEDSRKFYNKHFDEMNEGANVLWPEVQPLWKLMTWKWDNGSKAFNTEYQNNPVDEESMIFNPETFTYWDDAQPNRAFSHSEYVISLAVDFALGKQRGDYSAVGVAAKHKETGIIYIADSYGERIKPDGFIDVIVEMVKKWQPDVLAVEANAAQEFFATVLSERLTAEGYPASTRVKKVYNRSRKELRIETMLPYIENKTIQFSRKHALLLEQFERYGQGSHDDCIDSIEMAVSASKTKSNVIQTSMKRTR
jgi:predicted phage terminase large subunit-like protein